MIVRQSYLDFGEGLLLEEGPAAGPLVVVFTALSLRVFGGTGTEYMLSVRLVHMVFS